MSSLGRTSWSMWYFGWVIYRFLLKRCYLQGSGYRFHKHHGYKTRYYVISTTWLIQVWLCLVCYMSESVWFLILSTFPLTFTKSSRHCRGYTVFSAKINMTIWVFHRIPWLSHKISCSPYKWEVTVYPQWFGAAGLLGLVLFSAVAWIPKFFPNPHNASWLQYIIHMYLLVLLNLI